MPLILVVDRFLGISEEKVADSSIRSIDQMETRVVAAGGRDVVSLARK